MNIGVLAKMNTKGSREAKGLIMVNKKHKMV